MSLTLGLRIRGPIWDQRTVVTWSSAYSAYCNCLPAARVEEAGYLSVFQFPAEMRQHMAETGSPRDYRGIAGASHLTFDIDREGDISAALHECRLLVGTLEETFGVSTECVDVMFSGHKGFHVKVPTSLWAWQPHEQFPRTCRLFAESIAAEAKVTIDSSIYSHISLLRAPNSRHPKTGLHCVKGPSGLIDSWSVEEIRAFAKTPHPFESLTMPHATAPELQRVWDTAKAQVSNEHNSRQAAVASRTLNRLTKDIIRGEAIEKGSRHRLLYSAAANLAECGASLQLATDLLLEIGQESGLCKRDVLRQIECGHDRGRA